MDTIIPQTFSQCALDFGALTDLPVQQKKCCTKCAILKSPDDFYDTTRAGKKTKLSRCKACQIKYNLEQRKLKGRKKASPIAKRREKLKNKYGLEIAKYETMLEEQ